MLIDAPRDFTLDEPPMGCRIERSSWSRLRGHKRALASDVALAFIRDHNELDALVHALDGHEQNLASLWLCWPRRAGGHQSDLTDNVVRSAGLSLGLVDTKVAAIDANWSALRFSARRT
jgi:hypothetical protein